MKIYAYQKSSFVDFPGVISCVIFTPFCNFNCWYCHNDEVIYENKNQIDENEIFEYLQSRKKFIDGVVVSGGEPTFQVDLMEFLKKIKAMGFKVKLDTNGSRPNVLEKIIESGYVDFIAMDIKAPFNIYRKIACADVDIKSIKQSIKLLKQSTIEVEFRTTFSPDLTLQDIIEIAKVVGKKHNYAIQQYVKYFADQPNPHLEETVAQAAHESKKYVKNVTVKGLRTNIIKNI